MDPMNLEKGIIEKFISELPEKLFHLGLRIVLAVLVLLMGIQLIKLIRKVLKKALVKMLKIKKIIRCIIKRIKKTERLKWITFCLSVFLCITLTVIAWHTPVLWLFDIFYPHVCQLISKLSTVKMTKAFFRKFAFYCCL